MNRPNKKTGVTTDHWKLWLKEGRSIEYMVKQLDRFGIAPDLWFYLATDFKQWEARLN